MCAPNLTCLNGYGMNIWIDLANSPQVLVFRPVIAELEKRGHKIFFTTRDYAQTIPLANQDGLKHTVIGEHGGKRWSNIFYQTIQRAQQLRQWARTQPSFDLAVSHNSYSQALAANVLRVPFVTLMDYEHQPANHLCFRLARRVLVPECFPEARLRAFGAMSKTKKYPGIKEQLYLASFQPIPNYFEMLGIDTRRPIVVMRPPAPWAAYHRQFQDTLFDAVLQYVAARNVTILFVPRVRAQSEYIRTLGLANVQMPSNILDGPNLIFHAAAVISGGGTMNREAGVLGTPAYTVFTGKSGAADEWLVTRGRLKQLTSKSQFSEITLEGKKRHTILVAEGLVPQVTTWILETA